MADLCVFLLKHTDDLSRVVSENVTAFLDKETSRGLNTEAYYRNFSEKGGSYKIQSS